MARYVPPVNNILGQRFGMLTVAALSDYRSKKHNGSYWLCLCDCGNFKIIRQDALVGNISKSCGCMIGKTAAKFHTKHGHSRAGQISKTYSSWQSMKDRCLNPNFKQAKDYMDRGISVCDRWKNSFENFLADMGERPEGKELDRIDNNSGYSPTNCRWVTHYENMHNRRVSLKNRQGESNASII